MQSPDKQGPGRGQAPDNSGERYAAERERELIGCCFHDYGLLATLEAIGLTDAHFRVDLHRKTFRALIAFRDRGYSSAFVEDLRREGKESGKVLVAWADAAARLTGGDQELAEAIVYDRARLIIGRIHSTADRALWYEQLFQARAKHQIDFADHFVGITIGRFVSTKTGSCFPSYETIAKEGGLKLRMVERGIRKLKEQRRLQIGRGRPNILTPIVWAKLEAAKAKVSSANPATSNPSIRRLSISPNPTWVAGIIPVKSGGYRQRSIRNTRQVQSPNPPNLTPKPAIVVGNIVPCQRVITLTFTANL
ncbi:MAG: helix-turn-helix domain-containing protein [Xanthobacteraceae bacterium]